jgi:hypothetical protein
MSTFVLVHGSWHDGSAWQAVVDHLEAVGIRECLTAWGYFGLYKCPVVTR